MERTPVKSEIRGPLAFQQGKAGQRLAEGYTERLTNYNKEIQEKQLQELL